MSAHAGVVDLVERLLVVEDDGEQVDGVLRDGREGQVYSHLDLQRSVSGAGLRPGFERQRERHSGRIMFSSAQPVHMICRPTQSRMKAMRRIITRAPISPSQVSTTPALLKNT